MIKKLVSRALLSVVMDKQARDKLDGKARGKGAAPNVQDAASANKPVAARAALEDAEKTLEKRQDRQALIRQAVATQQQQAALLDELDPKKRQQLRDMAAAAFDLTAAGKPGR